MLGVGKPGCRRERHGQRRGPRVTASRSARPTAPHAASSAIEWNQAPERSLRCDMPDDLAARDGHLARAEARVAKHLGPRRRPCRAAVHLDRGLGARASRGRLRWPRRRPRPASGTTCRRRSRPARPRSARRRRARPGHRARRGPRHRRYGGARGRGLRPQSRRASKSEADWALPMTTAGRRRQADTRQAPTVRIRQRRGAAPRWRRDARGRTSARSRPDVDSGAQRPTARPRTGCDVGSPLVTNLTAGGEQPQVGTGRSGRPREAETGLVEQSVLLAAVAAAAAGHDVVPAVCPAPAAGHDMVDVLGLRAAVLAAMTVSHEHRAPRDRDTGLMRVRARS